MSYGYYRSTAYIESLHDITEIACAGHCLAYTHPITGFKDDSAYVTTKTADRNQRSMEDGQVLSDVIYAPSFHTWKIII